MEALLKATHALSDYRLVVTRGEPFNPVVLRVHSNPIVIIEKVLEQNRKAYTRLNEFLEMGINLANAGLLQTKSDTRNSTAVEHDQDVNLGIVEKQIVSMCIEAALREDDFETAYSFVVSRLAPSSTQTSSSSRNSLNADYSWKAALKAGQYIRTERSQQPTHLGTASGNLEIRHLEQRIECLATALRIAPSSQLQEIIKSFRRCEEQLDSAIKDEAEKEAMWNAASNVSEIPGAFDKPEPDTPYPRRNITASAAAMQTEEAPMSLFDLSRATAKAAQKNFNKLSNLPNVVQYSSQTQDNQDDGLDDQRRARKRDQLRDAATETLVSSVGWLIGANVKPRSDDS